MLKDLSEKELFILSVLPPVLLTVILLLLLRGFPDTLLESIVPLVPGLVSVTNHGDGCMCLRFESKRNVLDTGFKLLQKHGQMGADFLNRARSNLSVSPSSLESALGSVQVLRRLRSTAGSPNSSKDDDRLSLSLETGQSPLDRSVDSVEDTRADHQQEQDKGAFKGALREADLCPSRDAEAPRVSSKEHEVWINLRHLVRASSMPVLSLMFFLWDSAFIHRRASMDFPLLHCMNPESSQCFYIAQEYHLWRYPHYVKIPCQDMRERTTASETGFYFQEPKDARFYKCYAYMFNFNALISAVGDVMALTALAALVIIRASVQVNYDDVCQYSDILRKRHDARVHMVALIMLLVASLFSVSQLYGRWTNEFIFYAFLPGATVFSIFLLANRLELLDERLKKMEEDGVSETSSSEETRIDDCWETMWGWICGRPLVGPRSAPRAADAGSNGISRAASLGANGAGEQQKKEEEEGAAGMRKSEPPPEGTHAGAGWSAGGVSRGRDGLGLTALRGSNGDSSKAPLQSVSSLFLPRLPIPKEVSAEHMAYTALRESKSSPFSGHSQVNGSVESGRGLS